MSAGLTSEIKPLTVSQVTSEIKEILESAYPSLCVEGEISGLKKYASGHYYLCLKDANAVLPATIWRSNAIRLRFEPRDGMSVIAFGNLSVYEPQGRYQFQINRLLPQGEGPLETAFRQLKEKLFAKGYFDPKRKRAVPRWPRRIAIVTSPSGAAIRDMLETLGRRWPAVEVVVVPVRVQGVGAAAEIAAAIAQVNRLHAARKLVLDAVIIGRGGGSLEDLWAFNEEIVADAIVASALPIVSGVGHETDFTISDLVADVRALTPTAAAMHVAPDRLELLGVVRQASDRLRTGLVRRVERARQRLDDLRRRRPFRLPLDRAQQLSLRLDELAERLHRRRPLQRIVELQQRLEVDRQRLQQAIARKLERGRAALASTAAQLAALSPLNVLARGYSLTAAADGRLLRSTDEVRPGDRLLTRLSRGRIVSRIESIEFEPPPGASHE